MSKNELTVKNVDFFGDTLVAGKDNDGVVWVGVSWICKGMGLSEGQLKSERKKIQEDLVLSKGGRNFILPSNGGEQETLCLQLDYVPLWLAKISITPSMKENNPELVKKLVNYQLKAKDVLAAAFLPKPHNVKTLTISSRNIANILCKPKQHGVVLMEIRDCIAELGEMGFNTLDFFQESQYLAGNNEYRPQFLCTERGCEFFSGRLEPDDRQIFIAEFKDRFERMQNVLDGKPVKAARAPLPDSTGPADVKLFSNGKTGLIVIGDKVYTIASDKLPFIEKVVPELIQSNVSQVDEVIGCILSASGEQWGYELVTSYCYAERTEMPQIEQLGNKSIKYPSKVKNPEISQICLDNVVTLTLEQAKTRYNIGRSNLMKLADEIGAAVRVGDAGRKIVYSRKKLDKYFENHAN